MTRLPDSISWLPNPADSYTLDPPPTRKELADWCDRVREEIILYARLRYNSTDFKDFGPFDDDALRSYLEDGLSDATAPAHRRIR